MTAYVTRLGSGGSSYSDSVTEASFNVVGQSVDLIDGGDPLAVSGLPTSYQITQGGTHDLAQYVLGGTPPYTFALSSGTLPSGVTLVGSVLTASGAATIGTSGDVTFTATDSGSAYSDSVTVGAASTTGQSITLTDSVSAGSLSVPVGLTSVSGGSDLPTTFGHVFAEGEVPAGEYVTVDATHQVHPMTTWPDGSLRWAIISCRKTLTANTLANVTLTNTTSAPSGTNIALSALTTMNPSASVALSGFGTATLSSVIASPHRQTIAGPVMSEWIYRQPVGSDNHLVVWWRLRYYGGADLDIMVGVENGYLLVASPARKDYTATITINGTTRFNAAVTHLHHTRWAKFFWYGADPQVTPKHDSQYLTDTGMFPNYGWRSPSSTALDALGQSTTPFAQNNFPSAMGSAGADPSIGLLPSWDALYITSGDKRAWTSMLANANSYGRYCLYFRDESTQRPPSLNDHPTLVMGDDSYGILGTGTSTTGSYTPGAAQAGAQQYKSAHHPAPPYVAALLSGEWWFIEQTQFIAATNIMHYTDNAAGREGGKGLYKPDHFGTIRRSAWGLRTLAYACMVSQDGDVMRTEFDRQWDQNAKHWADRFVRGTISSGAYVNSFGIVPSLETTGSEYNPGSGQFWFAPWMHGFLTSTFGHVSDMKAGNTTNIADTILVRDFLYQFTVGLMGAPGDFDYRRGASIYDFPISSVETAHPPTFYASWAAMFAAYESFHSLPSISGGDLKLRRHSQDVLEPSVLDATTGYFANQMPARSLARQHGASGADAGWTRIIGSTTYQGWDLASGEFGFNDFPVFGIIPRT